jgi:molybdopterin-binding protein
MSARNHFPGVITAVKKGAVAASVEILSGPHRNRRDDHSRGRRRARPQARMHATAAVKATSVMVELME